MAGAGQQSGEKQPSHQHHVNSHDRIFGGFAESEGSPSRGQGGGVSVSLSPRRRRRWVKTRTQHLSTLSLNGEGHVGGGKVPTVAPGDHQSNELHQSHEVLPGIEPGSDMGLYQACGRNRTYRRPDGNPVTGEGYALAEHGGLQLTNPGPPRDKPAWR